MNWGVVLLSVSNGTKQVSSKAGSTMFAHIVEICRQFPPKAHFMSDGESRFMSKGNHCCCVFFSLNRCEQQWCPYSENVSEPVSLKTTMINSLARATRYNSNTPKFSRNMKQKPSTHLSGRVSWRVLLKINLFITGMTQKKATISISLNSL